LRRLTALGEFLPLAKIKMKTEKSKGVEAPIEIAPPSLWGSDRQAFKIDETSQLLGVHHSSVRRLIDRGELKSVIKLRHRLITRSEIVRFLNS
jgi:excisionase family DNA binding protein